MKCVKYVFLIMILLAGNVRGDWYEDYLRLQEFRRTLDAVSPYIPGLTRDNPFFIKPATPGFMEKGAEIVEKTPKAREAFQEGVIALVEGGSAAAKMIASSENKLDLLKNAAFVGLVLTAVPTVSYGIYKGSMAAIDIIKYKMTTPKVEIIQQEAGPIYGRWDRLARWWSGYITPAVIFDESVKKHLEEIKEKTKNIKDHIYAGDKSVTYTNLLLYGPPGTGKTMFAKVLADYTNMDFLPVTAASLMQDPVAFSNIVEMANRSSYGAIIFIDEADALFLDRNELLKSTAPDALAQYKALNHILAIIGQRNNRFMVVAATNFPHVIDEAMDRRFPEKVEMPLPSENTRFALLKMYIEKILFNEKYNSPAFVKAARMLLPEVFMKQLAAHLDGFSPSEIGSLIEGMRNATYGTKDRMITSDIVNDAINRAVSGHKSFAKKPKPVMDVAVPPMPAIEMPEKAAAAA